MRNLTLQQAEDALHWMMLCTRKALKRAVDEDIVKFKARNYVGPEPSHETLAGYCGFAQSYAHCMIEDYNLGQSRPLAMQTLPGRWSFGHVALIVKMDTTAGNKTFLLDPTFKQFQGKEEKILQNLPDGEYMADCLRQDGFVELTPERSVSYLSAFCCGINPFLTKEMAVTFIENPPPNYNNLWFPRTDLRDKGYPF